MIIFFILFVSFILVFFLLFRKLSPDRKGRIGEKRVSNVLSKYQYKERILNDVVFILKSGETFQIDHLLLTDRGMIIIESKYITCKSKQTLLLTGFGKWMQKWTINNKEYTAELRNYGVQSRRQKRLLGLWLKENGFHIPIIGNLICIIPISGHFTIIDKNNQNNVIQINDLYSRLDSMRKKFYKYNKNMQNYEYSKKAFSHIYNIWNSKTKKDKKDMLLFHIKNASLVSIGKWPEIWSNNQDDFKPSGYLGIE